MIKREKKKHTEERETNQQSKQNRGMGFESQNTKRFLVEAILDNAKPSKDSFDIIAFLNTKPPHTSANPNQSLL